MGIVPPSPFLDNYIQIPQSAHSAFPFGFLNSLSLKHPTSLTDSICFCLHREKAIYEKEGGEGGGGERIRKVGGRGEEEEEEK